jgi:hypothetical protein
MIWDGPTKPAIEDAIAQVRKRARLDGTGPIAPQSFVVGADPPAGFAESVPLADGLPSNIAIVAIVTTDRVSGVVVPFRVSSLRSDRIRTDLGQYVTPTDFRQSALTRCNT